MSDANLKKKGGGGILNKTVYVAMDYLCLYIIPISA